MLLSIDTSDNKKTIVSIGDFQKEVLAGIMKSQQTLPLIEEILKENNLKLSDITEIKLNEGPGSFTGLRVGCAIANALSWVLNIPVNGKKEIAVPKYDL